MARRTRKSRPESKPRAPSDPAPPTEAAASPFDPRHPAQANPQRPVEHVPWSYGQERITAMAVDPNGLHAYWEVSDPAIENSTGARASCATAGRAKS